MTPRLSLSLAALLFLPLGCADAPERSAEQAKAEATPAAEAPEVKAEPGSLELSAEELELIAADPSTLSREQNRKRAYALRKKVMQNPDSPQAKALEEARMAALGGELPLEHVKPDAKKEGRVIELPEALQDQRVSKGEPAQ
jgi:hypothetical protein